MFVNFSSIIVGIAIYAIILLSLKFQYLEKKSSNNEHVPIE